MPFMDINEASTLCEATCSLKVLILLPKFVPMNQVIPTIQSLLTFIGSLGGGELLLILALLVILFGTKKIPELARSLGKGIREFKDATKEIKDEIEGQSEIKKE